MNHEQKCSSFKINQIGEIQMHGILMKKPVGHKSNIWSKRFFILKDGFLFYYSESEKKNFEEKEMFNIHPKGVIPLGYATIEETSLSGVNYGITVSFADERNAICLGTDTDGQRRLWIEKLDGATKITAENCHLGDSLIKNLQDQALALRIEKEKYYQKFLEQAEEMASELTRKEEIEEYQRHLVEENLRLQALVTSGVVNQQIDLTDSNVEITENVYDIAKPSNALDEEKAIYQTINPFYDEKKTVEKSNNSDLDSDAENDAKYLADQVQKLSQEVLFLKKQKKLLEQKFQETACQLHQQITEKQNASHYIEKLKLEIKNLFTEKALLESRLEKFQREIFEEVDSGKSFDKYESTNQQTKVETMDAQEHPVEKNQEPPSTLMDVKNLKNLFEGYSNGFSPSKFHTRTSRRYTHIKRLRGIASNEDSNSKGTNSNSSSQSNLQEHVGMDN